MLQDKFISLGDNIPGVWTSVDTADVIQVIFPEIYRQYRSQTALKDGLNLCEVMVLEFKLGILNPVPRL